MKKVVMNANGLKIEYLESGHGHKKLILLHGLGGNCHDFEKMIPYFSHDYHVYSLTLPQYGTLDQSGKCYTIRTLHRYLKKVTHYMELHKPIIMGHSMGGMVGIHYAASYPKSIGRLITVSTPLSDFNLKLPLEWKLAVRFAIENSHAQDVIDYLLSRKTLFDEFSKVMFPGKSATRKIQTAKAFLSKIPVRSTGYFYHDLFSYSYKKLVEKVHTPTLVVYGIKDAEIAKFRGTALYDLIPKAKIVPMPAYHFIPIDMPHELSKVVHNWINS